MFTTDSRTKTFLTQMGVNFRYKNSIRYTDLEKNWAKENLARPVAVRDDAVLEYATLMENGSPAPAPILFTQSTGFRVLDGIQRLSAGKVIGCTQFPGYIVECDSDDIVTAIRVLANARLQGHAEPAEWTRRRAVEVLVVQKGMSVSEVARMGGWRRSDVERTANAVQWCESITNIGGPSLPDSMLDVIANNTNQNSLAASSQPIASFLHTIKKAKLSTEDATQYIEEFFQPISKARRQNEIYMSRLKEFSENPEIQSRIHGRKGSHLSKDMSLRRNLKAAVTVLDEIIESGEGLLNVDEFFQLLKKIDKGLKKFSRHLPQAAQERVPADRWMKNE